jgi:hypothetical protein
MSGAGGFGGGYTSRAVRLSNWLAFLVLLGILLPLPLGLRRAEAVDATARRDVLPLDQVRRGMKGYGLTVFEGTKPERFEVEVIDGEVPVSGQDGDTPALNRVALGTQAVSVWKDAFGLGETAGNVAIQLCEGTALGDASAPDTLQDHVRPDSLAAQPFETPGGNTVQSIVLKPTPITQDNINLVVDLGWETQEAVCNGVPAGTVPLCG